ncbi:protein of unknown function [Candidatus Methylocalor cossyra]|uniref:Uncharacterized protein n=1 Tax=Candidatus Methylocalor cossyra TaxID=3108543 RepID=A0ABM9NEU0_9GAMM
MVSFPLDYYCIPHHTFRGPVRAWLWTLQWLAWLDRAPWPARAGTCPRPWAEAVAPGPWIGASNR